MSKQFFILKYAQQFLLHVFFRSWPFFKWKNLGRKLSVNLNVVFHSRRLSLFIFFKMEYLLSKWFFKEGIAKWDDNLEIKQHIWWLLNDVYYSIQITFDRNDWTSNINFNGISPNRFSFDKKCAKIVPKKLVKYWVLLENIESISSSFSLPFYFFWNYIMVELVLYS